MKKRIFAIMLAALIALAAIIVTGCSDDNGEAEPAAANGEVTYDANGEENNEPEAPPSPVIEPEEIPEFITIGNARFSTADTELILISSNLEDSDIENVKYMVNLTLLSFNYNRISDVSVLAGLTNLTTLALHGNRISDVSVLAGLTNLTTLILFDNPLNDLSVLAELPHLRELGLSSNQIGDISALFGLTNLQRLQILGRTLSNEQLAELRAALPNTAVSIH